MALKVCADLLRRLDQLRRIDNSEEGLEPVLRLPAVDVLSRGKLRATMSVVAILDSEQTTRRL